MKTRRCGWSGGWGAFLAAALAAGCGARTVGDAGTGGPASTNLAAAAVDGGAVAAGGTNAPAEGELAALPPVRRSEMTPAALPPELQEVVKLVEGGAGDEVLRAYVGSSQVAYELTLDQILYLRDLGIPDGVIAAMMRRGSELRDRNHEVEAMQTNLVAAVEQIRQAIATNAPSPADAESGEAAAPGPESAPAPSPVVAQAAPAPADAPQEVTQFYSSLSPYGSWYTVPSYGWVWQPSAVVVNPGWAPYHHGGRWVWSDWGWYWCSDYSWGWAPFHYGRWATYPGLGWCWVPGSVWGPSWVTWRQCGTHIGWAPLPPACGWSAGVGLTWNGGAVAVGFGFGLASTCYTFVPAGNFCHRNLSHYAVRGHQVGGVYQNTTIVNNVIQGNNNTIINNGVGYNTVASLTRNEVPKVQVKTLPDESPQPLRADRMERSKDGLVVYRPAPQSAPATPGGGPAAPLRSEVRPSVSTASGVASVPVSGARSPSSLPSRPSVASRYGTSDALPAKAPESRGAGVGTPAAPGRPSSASYSTTRPSVSTPQVIRTAPARTGSGTAPKTTEQRGMATTTPPASSGSVSRVNRGSAPMVSSPVTTPLPLGDPSRNLPTRSVTPSRTTVPAAPTAPTAKTALENRSMSAPAAPNRSYQSVPRPAVSAPAPAVQRPMAPNVAPARPSYSVPAPAAVAPRPTYSAPAPTMSAPRPTVSAPAPVMSAPRPTYSAPAPAVAPRPAVSSPSPASAPAAGPRGGGGRGQPN